MGAGVASSAGGGVGKGRVQVVQFVALGEEVELLGFCVLGLLAFCVLGLLGFCVLGLLGFCVLGLFWDLGLGCRLFEEGCVIGDSDAIETGVMITCIAASFS